MGEGSPTKIDDRTKGTLILPSLPEGPGCAFQITFSLVGFKGKLLEICHVGLLKLFCMRAFERVSPNGWFGLVAWGFEPLVWWFGPILLLKMFLLFV